MKLPSISSEFWFLGIGSDSFTKATLSLPQTDTLGIHEIGNCDIQKRLDLDSALGPHISSAIYPVTWVRSPPSLCAWISHQQSEFVSALPCVPLSTVLFMTFPCSAVYWEVSPHRRSAQLASGWGWLQEALAGDRVGGEERSREATLPIPHVLFLK